MSSAEKIPYPFKIIPLEDELQKRIAKDFEGYPNGLVSTNDWGFKLSGTINEALLEDLYNYPLDPRDVWVVTPPKCGTTWTQEMVWLIANDLDYEGAKTPLMPNRWSFIDFPAIADTEYMTKFASTLNAPPLSAMAGDPNRPSPRFIKSHLPMCMNNPRLLDVCKVVYVARNPKDACVSYYNHNRLIRCHEYMGDLELFMEYFMKSNIVETPFLEHMIEAWNLRHHPNMCFIFFEDMKRDLKSEIRKVAKFLGKSFSDEEIAKLASHLHIDNFKKNPFVNSEFGKQIGFMHQDRGNFIRKGKTGDWKNHFTPEMNAKFDRWMADKMRGTDLRFVQELDRQD
ncbi:sulfotransferase family cytosolic 1B member 1-like [Pollicipes pollicipes]|uniref:sulfotransferase family cytosolic 1B member 1-like n=1 Tax=Pollicipes pollicipes TaxID=41117 RepID=UPI001884ED8F|nr:sulfotransferase family cytosolic 1B member 1-like [Pollicipes pollicipes]XP_037072950.1 sulfotransferase family cytosolic 1B member 1-like [Pollicipes pollicipes]XP_037072951.1 sulfotransferase family cytosolic 1B member 1-like [Pollicipes pollicipes]XP_037073430.1 sulfotransferase family cytosolic 1B member 1-like [Pollicipes pollicipes]XP_037073431.1 sulfotransferase family cytosolic 1B member 1-like [Pollicipes pollicipes]XP_037073432.1 sulfotransferase family cytosolic 1B member 1-like